MNRVYEAPVIQLLRDLWAQGLSARAIAERMGISHNAVSGLARRNGLPSRNQYVVNDTVRHIRTDLAEQMANGCPTVSEAARRIGIAQSRADLHWQAIRNGLDAASHVPNGGRWAV